MTDREVALALETPTASCAAAASSRCGRLFAWSSCCLRKICTEARRRFDSARYSTRWLSHRPEPPTRNARLRSHTRKH